jgi:hypothetical protein
MNKNFTDPEEYLILPPRSNMHDRKGPFTGKNGDIQRSCAASVYDACTRSDTVGNGFRIRSYTTAVYGHMAPCVIAYGRTRLSQLYNLMNSIIIYFILFILVNLDGLNQETVSILI